MRLAPWVVLLLTSGCSELFAPRLESNAKPVTDEAAVAPVHAPGAFPASPVAPLGSADRAYPELPTSEFPALTVGRTGSIDRVYPERPVAVPLVTNASVTTEPVGVSKISELREVRVKLEVSGAHPSEVAVEFTAPSGQTFERQAARLTGTVYDQQAVEFVLPVAGTLIETSSLIGTWQARFFLHGAENSWLTFEVTP